MSSRMTFPRVWTINQFDAMLMLYQSIYVLTLYFQNGVDFSMLSLMCTKTCHYSLEKKQIFSKCIWNSESKLKWPCSVTNPQTQQLQIDLIQDLNSWLSNTKTCLKWVQNCVFSIVSHLVCWVLNPNPQMKEFKTVN